MDEQKPPEQTQSKKWILPVVWLIFSLFVTWRILTLPSSLTPEVAIIPYSIFLDEVRANNIAQVEISGNKITGSFVLPTSLAPADLSRQDASETIAYTHFQTAFPEVVGDPDLIMLLVDHRVKIEVINTTNPWLATILIQSLPFLLLIGLFIWMGRQATRSQAGVFNFGQTQARYKTDEQQKVTFDDVAGADEAKTELSEVVDFLRNPSKYREIGAKIPRGTLLIGPPGTGKTLLARAVAGEADVPFFNLSASEFVEMFVGVGASRVRDLFKRAKAEAPAIVFIDELDAVGRRRGAGMGTVNDEREQTLNQMLAEMDGFDGRQEVIVLAATNRPDVLDPALLRPGRFDRQVTVNLPDRRGRAGILKIHTKHLRLAEAVDLDALAGTTTGLSGADLANLCNEAALIAARYDRSHITMADFSEAQDKIMLGGVRPLILNEHERRVIAYHEAGHALVAWLTPAADPVYKATIIPRGRALGVTEQVPDEDRYNYSRAYMLARLAVLLGGRVAEEIAIGDITTGAENDLTEATRLARQMITRWGMSSLGLATFTSDGEHPFLGYRMAQGPDYSEATAAQIDQHIQALLAKHHEVVHHLLTNARSQLDILAEALLQKETLDQAEISRILGPRPKSDAQTNQPDIVDASNPSDLEMDMAHLPIYNSQSIL